MNIDVATNQMAPLPKISSGKQLAEFFIANPISVHPFFKRTDNRHPGYISVILENGRELDITGFLARVIAMADDLAVRCKLVPQLYDELGNGNIANLHVRLIGQYLNAVKPYCNLSDADRAKLEQAYTSLGAVYRALFKQSEYYEAMGVAVANELIVQPIFEYMKDITLNGDVKFNEEDILWITSHDELEEGHVNDSFELAALIATDEEKLNRAMKGGYELYAAIWRFFDTVNELELSR